MIVASAVYRLALSLWVGGIALFTFVVTPVIFRTHGRDAAGRIVGSIFPVYFRYGLVVAGPQRRRGGVPWRPPMDRDPPDRDRDPVDRLPGVRAYPANGAGQTIGGLLRNRAPRGSRPHGIFPPPRDLDGRQPRGPP